MRSTLLAMRNPRFVPLILVAGAALACRSSDEKAQPAPKPESKPMAAMPVRPAPQPAPAPAPAAQPGSRADRLAALTKEQKDAMNAYYKAIDDALAGNQNPTAEEWQKVQEKVKEPDNAGFQARAQQLIDEDPKDITAFNAIRWMMDNARDSASTKTAVGLLEKYHLDRPEMASVCNRLPPDARGLLDKLLANSPHAEVRGQACFAIAEGLKQDIQFADELKTSKPEETEGLKNYLGAEKVDMLGKLDVPSTQQQIEKLYDRVASEFGEVKLYAGTDHETTLGQRAGAALYEIRNLAVGKTTPEIEGVDLDSVAFKLSDYRGKVVLLDFWGNW